MLAQTIDEVLAQLDAGIARAKGAQSPLGYFPALYRKVTARVKQGIEQGEFDDGPRMERLDVIFANRYLAACEALDRREAPTRSWAVAFDAAGHWPPIVLHHLMLGMNAHINLDLGIAAAQAAPGSALPSLERDFNRINVVLASLVGGVKKDMETIWPLLGVLDRLVGSAEDRIANFSMEKARNAAWTFANQLAAADPLEHSALINGRDADVELFGQFLWRPGILARLSALVVRLTERGRVDHKISLIES
jgi:hypothetical protein